MREKHRNQTNLTLNLLHNGFSQSPHRWHEQKQHIVFGSGTTDGV